METAGKSNLLNEINTATNALGVLQLTHDTNHVNVSLSLDMGTHCVKCAYFEEPPSDEMVERDDVKTVKWEEEMHNQIPSELAVTSTATVVIGNRVQALIKAGMIAPEQVISNPKLAFVPDALGGEPGLTRMKAKALAQIQRLTSYGIEMDRDTLLMLAMKEYLEQACQYIAGLPEMQSKKLCIKRIFICLPQTWIGSTSAPFKKAAQSLGLENVTFAPEADCAAAYLLCYNRWDLKLGDMFTMGDGGAGTVDAATFKIIATPEDEPWIARRVGNGGDTQFGGSHTLNMLVMQAFFNNFPSSEIEKATGQLERAVWNIVQSAVEMWKRQPSGCLIVTIPPAEGNAAGQRMRCEMWGVVLQKLHDFHAETNARFLKGHMDACARLDLWDSDVNLAGVFPVGGMFRDKALMAKVDALISKAWKEDVAGGFRPYQKTVFWQIAEKMPVDMIAKGAPLFEGLIHGKPLDPKEATALIQRIKREDHRTPGETRRMMGWDKGETNSKDNDAEMESD